MGAYSRLARVAAVCVVAFGVSTGRADAQIAIPECQFSACGRVGREPGDMPLAAENQPRRPNETRLHSGVPRPQGPQVDGSLNFPAPVDKALAGFLNSRAAMEWRKANIVGVWPVRSGSR